MNNEVIFAAAGNGKTYSLCKEAIKHVSKTDKYIMLVTYTNEGVRSLEKEYRKQNGGVIDKHVIIKTWYSFLMSELIKPYQCMLTLKYKHYKKEYNFPLPENYIRSIAFYQEEGLPRWYNRQHIQYYINSGRDIRKDTVSCLAAHCIDASRKKAINRIENIYSHIFFDELQDYAGWDLEIFIRLFASSIKVKCVGDYKQATFRTNNSAKNKQYRDDRIRDFFVLQEKKGNCSLLYENVTRRFNSEICTFINIIHSDSESFVYPDKNMDFENENAGVFIIDTEHMEKYCNYYKPTILRYRNDSEIPFNHNCQVFNYGNSKGATFERTVIIPVGTVSPFIKEQKEIKSNQTRSKFFVACTRARHSVVFVIPNPKESDLFKPVQIKLGIETIQAYKYFCENSN